MPGNNDDMKTFGVIDSLDTGEDDSPSSFPPISLEEGENRFTIDSFKRELNDIDLEIFLMIPYQ